jgi:biotin transport system substrate-specific component
MQTLTYADLLKPQNKTASMLYDITLVLFASTLIGISAHIALPVFFSPVPVTAQTLVVLLTAAALGPKRALAAVMTYILQGTLGAPVFAMGKAGPAVLVGPTAGYIFGFAAAALLVGTLCKKGADKKTFTTVAAMAAGSALILLCGMGWLAIITNPQTAIKIGLVPFIPGEIAKIALAAVILPTGWKFINKTNGRNNL